jgi:hypothetical protein
MERNMPVLSMKISPGLERALYDADIALLQVLKHPKELSAAEFHELYNVHKEFDIIRRALERRK